MVIKYYHNEYNCEQASKDIQKVIDHINNKIPETKNVKVYFCYNLPDGKLNRKLQGKFLQIKNIILLNPDAEDIYDTLYHEMCHYLCSIMFTDCKKAHGVEWLTVVQYFNEKLNVNVDIKNYVKGGKLYE